MTLRPLGQPEETWEITAALRHFGWQLAGGIPGRYELWRPDPTISRLGGAASITDLEADEWQDAEALVPLDPSRRDFPVLMGRARKTLTEVMGVEASRFFDTLAQTVRAALDATRFKKSTSFDNGLIAWEQGESLYDAARQGLMAAAKASKTPRRYHGNASAYLAHQFLESAMMGQTEIGSYVVTAYSPANKRFHTTQAEADRATGYGEEFGGLTGRDVIRQLEVSLSAVREAMQEFRRTPKLEVFAEAVPEGVSYELVSSLGLLSEDSSESAVEISFFGATEPSRRVEFEFFATDVPVLDQAASYLAVTRAPERVTLRGVVTLLERPKAGEAGVVRLDVTSGGEARKVRVRLDADDYEAALNAHTNDREMEVTGNLQREGRYFWLYDAVDLRLPPEGGSSTSSPQLGFDFEEDAGRGR